MKILITGGAGFIGTNFVRYWSKNYPNDFICVYDKLTYAANINNLSPFIKMPDFKFVQADIVDTKLLKETLSNLNIDIIVNFAGESHVDRSISNPDAFIKTNILGVYSILEAIRENPSIRLHHISTDEVYGSLPLELPNIKFSEDTAYCPKSPYSASKASGDFLVRAYINTYNIKATISNCSNNFGPYQFPEKLIPLTIIRALMDQEIPVYGNGLQVRDWIHVEDHCYGIDLILKKGKLGETYLLGGSGEMPNIKVIKTILGHLNKPESLVKYVEDRKGHDIRYAIDFSKAQKELGYKPQKLVDIWLKETVDWYVNNKDFWNKTTSEAFKVADSYLK